MDLGRILLVIISIGLVGLTIWGISTDDGSADSPFFPTEKDFNVVELYGCDFLIHQGISEGYMSKVDCDCKLNIP